MLVFSSQEGAQAYPLQPYREPKRLGDGGWHLSLYVQKYRSPPEGFDVLIYTESGLMGREVESIHSSDIVVIAGGRSGTLGELAVSYDEGWLTGVLTSTDAIADLIPLLNQKPTGAVVLYDDDPARLIDRLVEYYQTRHCKHVNCFCQTEPLAAS